MEFLKIPSKNGNILTWELIFNTLMSFLNNFGLIQDDTDIAGRIEKLDEKIRELVEQESTLSSSEKGIR